MIIDVRAPESGAVSDEPEIDQVYGAPVQRERIVFFFSFPFHFPFPRNKARRRRAYEKPATITRSIRKSITRIYIYITRRSQARIKAARGGVKAARKAFSAAQVHGEKRDDVFNSPAREPARVSMRVSIACLIASLFSLSLSFPPPPPPF